VAEAIPAAWAIAPPEEIEAARLRAVGLVLQRAWSDLDEGLIDEASALAGAMVAGLSFEGKPLAGANAAVPEPEDAATRLWQYITVLREWRGDAHVAALGSAPVNALEALVLHAGTGQVPADILKATRQWPDSAWQNTEESLAKRGLIDGEGALTIAGQEFRGEIERRTNGACVAMVDAVGEADTTRLVECLRPLRKALQADGAFARLGG
jgi:hypothetical protein